MALRPRRSMLFMPGSNSRALEKAKTIPADGIIIDLEDAVAPSAKADAREQAARAVRDGGFGRREVIIRVNALDTPWASDDIDAAVGAGADGILIPKISTPKQIEPIATRLFDLRANQKLRLWAMIETPLAILNIQKLAAMADDYENRLAGFVIGPNDLAKETRARIVPGRAPMAAWLMECVMAAHMHGIDILDGVYNDIANQQGFRRECEEGRDMGFDGKTLIHPSQVEPCNAAFAPTTDEVASARKVIAAFEKPENVQAGVVQIDGRMVERMHADIARRTVAIADAVAAQD